MLTFSQVDGQNPVSEQAKKELRGLGKIVLRFHCCKQIKQVDARAVEEPRLKQWDILPEEALKGRSVTQQIM